MASNRTPHPTSPAPPPPRARRSAWWLVTAATLLLAGCFDQTSGGGGGGLGEQAAGDVRTDLSCDELTDLTRAQLDRVVDGMQLGAGGEDLAAEPKVAESGASGLSTEADAAPTTTSPAGDAAQGRVVAGTNLREVGVDEADIVKTDGKRIVSMQDGTLRVVALDGTPALDGVLQLSAPGASSEDELFLRGDEALVILSSFGGDVIVDDVAPPETGQAVAGSDGIGEEPGAPSTETTVPETTVPETTVPDTTVPETTVPDTTVPETTVPDTTVPETTVPDTTVPETTTTLAPPRPIPFTDGVTLVRVDLGDPSHPTELERTTVEGTLVAARMVDGIARVVVRSTPTVMTDVWAASDAAEAREVIDEADVDQLLPRIAAGGQVGSLGECSDVAVLPVSVSPGDEPVGSSYVGDPTTVSVLTVGGTLGNLSPTTVQGLAEVVYASPTALYVASTDWTGDRAATAVHRFDTSGDAAAAYTGSGTVPGVVLDDYSLSEADGDLRVVTTVDTMEPTGTVEPTDAPATSEDDVVVVTPSGTGDVEAPDAPMTTEVAPPAASTEGRLTVLRPDDHGALHEISHVEDLGKGERVQSVRYVGDLAYVVTFRQTDPLFAIDLSDPAAPEVLGELKVTGFSQYLHPVGEGRLLGLGREADASGVDEGFKVSLFDVTDPTAPVELDKIVVPDGWSLAAEDPHAFTWDPVARHAVFPIERSGSTECGPNEDCASTTYGPTEGALVVAVEGDHLTQVAELRHVDDPGDPDAWQAQIVRSMVVDRDLWTLSGVGLGRSDADTPDAVELIRF